MSIIENYMNSIPGKNKEVIDKVKKNYKIEQLVSLGFDYNPFTFNCYYILKNGDTISYFGDNDVFVYSKAEGKSKDKNMLIEEVIKLIKSEK